MLLDNRNNLYDFLSCLLLMMNVSLRCMDFMMNARESMGMQMHGGIAQMFLTTLLYQQS